jgi:phosphoribosyl-AMP cyclohydrolase
VERASTSDPARPVSTPVSTDDPTADPTGGPVASPVPFSEEELGRIAYDRDGLVGAIVQDSGDRTVLMFAWMNEESLRRTLETGRSWFWSRSRQELWCKGETSGDRQYVRSVHYDCDGDAVLLTVEQTGAGACHTGHRSCFFRAFGEPPPGR